MAILNLAASNPEWGIKFDECCTTESLNTCTISTRDSREDGFFLCTEAARLAAIAEAYGATWSIQLDAEREGLEFFIC